MVIKEVPPWAPKCIAIGIVLPVLCFFFLQGLEGRQGFVHDMLRSDVQVPFLWGQNPVLCAQEGVQKILNGAFKFAEPVNTYACVRNTLIPYSAILLLSAFFVLLGIYMYARGNQLANLWPTDWNVFDEKNAAAQEKAKKKKPELRLDNPDDKPISPRDGGF